MDSLRSPQLAALCAKKMEYLDPVKNSNIKLLILIVMVVMIGPTLNYLWNIYSSWTETLPLCESITWLETRNLFRWFSYRSFIYMVAQNPVLGF